MYEQSNSASFNTNATPNPNYSKAVWSVQGHCTSNTNMGNSAHISRLTEFPQTLITSSSVQPTSVDNLSNLSSDVPIGTIIQYQGSVTLYQCKEGAEGSIQANCDADFDHTLQARLQAEHAQEPQEPPNKLAKLEPVESNKAAPTKSAKSSAKSKSKDALQQNAEEKYKHREEHNLSGYNKRQILNHLKQHGSSERSFEDALASIKVRKDIAMEFFNKHVADAQEHVYQECDSLSFDNISAWLSLFKAWQLPEHCFYELAVITNAIANTESHPEPSELAGVDLKAIYKFLGNSLMGLPQPELDAASAGFLASEFEMLINDANTDAADIETKNLKQQLQSSAPPPPTTNRKQKFSLDPLQLEDKI